MKEPVLLEIFETDTVFSAEFFMIIGVDEETANNDAEGIEHHLHPETMKKLEEFINELKKHN